MGLLKKVAGGDQVHFELVRELLEVERSYRTSSRRAKLFDRLEDAFRRGFYEDVEDATQRALRRRTLGKLLEDIKDVNVDFGDAASATHEALGKGDGAQDGEAQ
jgi:DNA sulfur modification protein DndC